MHWDALDECVGHGIHAINSVGRGITQPVHTEGSTGSERGDEKAHGFGGIRAFQRHAIGAELDHGVGGVEMHGVPMSKAIIQ